MRVLIVSMLTAALVFGTEIDFTDRDETLKDSRRELNKLMNHYISASVKSANGWKLCDGERFRDDLHKRIGGIFWTTIEDDITKSFTIDKRTKTRAESIYRGISFFEAPALYLANFGDLLRVGPYFIGSDKIGHFIEEGFNYYDIIHRQRKSLQDALAFGERAEIGHFGLMTTGVYSSADLAANYQGYNEFWRALIEAPNPYVSCENGLYKMNRLFDVAEHANWSWDEGVNCSRYKNEKMMERIASNIRLLEEEKQTRFTCPIMPEQCASMISYFGEVSSAVITKECFEITLSPLAALNP